MILCCHAFHFVEIGIRIRISPPQRIYNSKIILPSISVSSILKQEQQQQPPSTRKTPVIIMMMKNLEETEETETITDSSSSSSSSEHFFDLNRWQAGGDDVITSFSHTCFNDYWSTLPSIITANDNNNNNNSNNNVVNPYDFSHRMALGKYLIENTNTGGEEIWGSNSNNDDDDDGGARSSSGNNNDTNFLHGYSSKHWFWVYCGAAEAGLVPKITLLRSDNDTTLLVQDDIGFQKSVQVWKDFWRNDHAAFIMKRKKDDEDDDDDEEQSMLVLYESLWKTHKEIIQISLQYGKELQDILPEEDRNVGLGWCTMVDILAATNWPLLSLDSLCKFGCGYLPTKRLGPTNGSQNTVQWMKINRPMEYTTINSLYQLMETPENIMNLACTFFARVSRWKVARNKLPRTVHILTHGNWIQKCLSLSRVIMLAIIPKYRASSSLLEAVGVTSMLLAAFAVFTSTGKTKKLLLN
ncbi:hypothetical protein FRACYDRAFT_248035 [Fragilariopsis cylindrus CCMP1102]|uniref:Uncharacterized protein n=1 Tax=Fragilariopsis cylindrus CCMP1102 TaxID=635003 RepID=A0A1E7EVA0_9STRA|nr:hypothetical protein FRACYDRAFT_248035 [Fragilariopsis cylindrus CCMP1102]|eukprot:OEU09777.1 hypothetical protein FRACYDRAFT_248035 [Fragilariopsis cylindrus CCMP1102]